MDASRTAVQLLSRRTKGAVGRWLQFNLVGILGAGVQLALLTAFTGLLGIDPRLATIAAVELTLLHNFALHERWTWMDRPAGSLSGRLERLLKFHLCNGLVSMVGNVAVIQLLVVQLGWPVAPAGLVAIVSCSLANFALSHHLVFREWRA